VFEEKEPFLRVSVVLGTQRSINLPKQITVEKPSNIKVKYIL